MYRCQWRGGVNEAYFGVLSQASDKLLLQYWCHYSRLTADYKSQVTVIYRFTNTCFLCFHIIAAYYLCELAKLRKLVQTWCEVNPEEPIWELTQYLRPVEIQDSNSRRVRQLVTRLRSCARLALCLEVVDGSWLLWFTGNSTCVLYASQWIDS